MRKLFWYSVLVVLSVPALVQAFNGDVSPIPAVIVADRTIEVTGVNAHGYIEGSDVSGKKKILFKAIEKIGYSNNTYAVTTRDGQQYKLKFARLTTHYTSPTFDCMVKNPDTGKIEEARLDFTTFKSLTFKALAGDSTSKAKTPKLSVAPTIDRKNPKAVAEALLKAIRSDDVKTVQVLLNKTNQKKISPKEFPEMMKELKEKVGTAETLGALKPGPKFLPADTVCAFLRTEGAEAFVITLTKEGEEFGFEDIHSPDAAQWEKTPDLK